MGFAGRLTDIGKSITQGFLFTRYELDHGAAFTTDKKLKETTSKLEKELIQSVESSTFDKSGMIGGIEEINQHAAFSSLRDTRKESPNSYCTTTTHHSHNHNFHVTHCTTIITL